MPIRTSLTLLTLGLAIWFLKTAQSFVVPVIVSIILALTLMPLVRLGERIRMPVALTASVLVFGALALGIASLSSVADDALLLANRLPQIVDTMKLKLGRMLGGFHVAGGHSMSPAVVGAPVPADPASLGMADLQSSATDLSWLGAPAGSAPSAIDGIAASSKVQDLMTTTAAEFVAGLGTATVILLLTFFFLISADRIKRKLLIAAGDTLNRKKIALRTVEESARQTQLHLGIVVLTNIFVGVLSWALLAWLDISDAGAWSLALGFLHTIPYFGAAVGAILVSGAVLMQTESWAITLQVIAGLLAIFALVGTVVTTFLQGRVARMDPAVVFTGVLLFAWIWGAWGLLLGAPLLAIAKTIADNTGAERLAAILGK